MSQRPVNPIGAEFGEPDKVQPIIPVKPLQEVDTSEAFKLEMEKKARRVNEKEREEQRSATQEEHELAAVKPLIKQALDQNQAEQDDLLQPKAPTSEPKAPTAPTSDKTPAKTKVATTDSDAPTNTSQEDSNLVKKLPDAPQPTTQEKPHTEYVAKKMAPPPLTTPVNEGTKTPEKKQTPPIQTQSSGQGDTSSKQKPPTPQPLQRPQQAAPTPKTTLQQPAPAPKPIAAKPETLPAPKPQAALPPAPAPKEIPPAPAPIAREAPPQQVTPPSQEMTDLEVDMTSATPQMPEAPAMDGSKLESSADVSPFATPYTAQKKDDVIRTSRQELELGEGPSSVSPPPQSDFSGGGKKQDEKESQEQAAASKQLLDTVFPTDQLSTPFQEAVGFDRLPPHVLDLFDRIVGVITVMQMQGKTETTVHINQPGSPIQGAEVVITHVSTAPGSYNIELKGSPEAIVIFQQNLDQLKKSFQRREEENKAGKKEFNFKIHDIRISLKDGKST